MNDNKNPWADTSPNQPEAQPSKPIRPTKPQARPAVAKIEFDLEGLMTDFPTAKELERFVFDETGTVLNLKGRSNKLKYQIAMDVLNGADVDPAYLGRDNPYLEKTDLVPEEPMKTVAPKEAGIPSRNELQNEFYSPFVPHIDPDYRAQGKKMHVTFRKYKNGVITYEVLGPIEPKPVGEKIDKWGKVRPEIIKWTDPRTPESIIQREDGTFTPVGRRLKAMMSTMKYNNTNQWLRYIDREFVTLDQKAAANPWDLD